MATNREDSAIYISVVVAARNDNHGGNMLGRMQAFVDSWMEQAEQSGLKSEIVVVEWNPPAGRPKLASELCWQKSSGTCEVRFVEVPPEVHEQFPHAEAIPLHQMIAKNVGIRRARGQFVLVTNIDILFSPELMQFLSARSLQRGSIYRIDRHDVASDIPARASARELQNFCGHNCLRVFAREGAFDVQADGSRGLTEEDIVSPEDGIVLDDGWFTVETDDDGRFRWMETAATIRIERPSWAMAELVMDLETGPSAGGPLQLEFVDLNGAPLGSTVVDGRCSVTLHLPAALYRLEIRLVARGRRLALARDLRFLNLRAFGMSWREQVYGSAGGARSGTSRRPKARSVEVTPVQPARDWSCEYQAPSANAAALSTAAYLHTNACGDFTLLSREDWHSLRAYPEFPIWPMHIDSLMCYTAHHAGIREVILREPLRIFHIQHFSGAGWTPEGEAARIARIDAKRIPVIEYSAFLSWIGEMRRLDAPMIFNKSDWGLGDAELAETQR